MDKKLISKLKQKLEQEKESLEEELKSFAKKPSGQKENWDTRYPKFDGEKTDIDEETDEVEEYEVLLPIEHTLESRLKDVNLALEKIRKGKYAQCEKCKKRISKERLNACPEARTCGKCK